MHRILLPWEHYIDVERGNVKEAMGDLYPRWVGTRELLLHGLNPYGTEVSHKIQIGFYGHPIEQSYDKPRFEIIDEQRFAYPVYVVFLLAPTVHLEFAKLQNWAPAVFGGLTAISVGLWLAALRWRPPPWVTFALVLLVLSSPQIAQGLRLRQIGLLVAFLLTAATWCVTRNRPFAAGVLLAVATIKPQMVSICLVWFFIWSLGDWKRRWPLAAGFGLALGILAGAGEILVRGWVRYFIEGVYAYRKYFPTTSPVRLILGSWIGGGLSLLGVIVLFSYAWSRRKAAAGSPEFAQALSWFFITSLLRVTTFDSLQPGALAPTDITAGTRLGNVAAVEPDRVFCPHRMAFRMFSSSASASARTEFVAANSLAAFGLDDSHAFSGPLADVHTLATNRLDPSVRIPRTCQLRYDEAAK